MSRLSLTLVALVTVVVLCAACASLSIIPLLVCLLFGWVGLHTASVWAGICLIAILVQLFVRFALRSQIDKWSRQARGLS